MLSPKTQTNLANAKGYFEEHLAQAITTRRMVACRACGWVQVQLPRP